MAETFTSASIPTGIPPNSRSAYSLSAFSAADVPRFRSPFAYAVRGREICISYMDAAIASAADMDDLEEVEHNLRRNLVASTVFGAVADVRDDGAWRKLEARGRIGGLFACRIDAWGGIEFVSAGHSVWLAGISHSITPLGGRQTDGAAAPLESGELMLPPGFALMVGNVHFRKEIEHERLQAAVASQGAGSAQAIRDAVAYEWAHSAAAQRSAADSGFLVVKAGEAPRASRYTDRVEDVPRFGRTVATPGSRSYGTTDLSFWPVRSARPSGAGRHAA